MKKLKKLSFWNKRFFGKATHITAAVTGFGMIVYSIYWLGRSEEINEILDIVQNQEGSFTFDFYDKTGKKVPIHMSTD